MLLLAGDVCEHRCVIMIYLVITLRGHQQNKYPITTIEAWSLVDHNPIWINPSDYLEFLKATAEIARVGGHYAVQLDVI